MVIVLGADTDSADQTAEWGVSRPQKGRAEQTWAISALGVQLRAPPEDTGRSLFLGWGLGAENSSSSCPFSKDTAT
jgi:hypothetical protein